jgi:hypothetical protein
MFVPREIGRKFGGRLVGGDEQRTRDGETEGLGGFEVGHNSNLVGSMTGRSAAFVTA